MRYALTLTYGRIYMDIGSHGCVRCLQTGKERSLSDPLSKTNARKICVDLAKLV